MNKKFKQVQPPEPTPKYQQYLSKKAQNTTDRQTKPIHSSVCQSGTSRTLNNNNQQQTPQNHTIINKMTKTPAKKPKKRKPTKKLSEDEKNQIYLLKCRGHSFQSISKQFNVDRKTAERAYYSQIPLPEETEQQFLRQLANIRLENLYADADSLLDELSYPVKPDLGELRGVAAVQAYKAFVEECDNYINNRLKVIARKESLVRSISVLNNLQETVVHHLVDDSREVQLIRQMISDAQLEISENPSVLEDPRVLELEPARVEVTV